MARKTVTFLLPGTAGMAIGTDDLARKLPGLSYDVRGARYGMSYVITATPGAARKLADAVAVRAKPDFPRGSGQPSSWGHGCRKALPRIRKALAGAGK